LRFAAILHLSDKAIGDPNYDSYFTWKKEEAVDSQVMSRALKLADYFFTSAVDTYERVQKTLTAPQDVLLIASMIKLGRSNKEIAGAMWGDDSDTAKVRMYRLVKKYIKEYPRVFNAIGKV